VCVGGSVDAILSSVGGWGPTMSQEEVCKAAMAIRLATNPAERRTAWLDAYSVLTTLEIKQVERLIKHLDKAEQEWKRIQGKNGH